MRSSGAIPAEAALLIDLLVGERLLSVGARVTHNPSTGEETRESTIEPTHEALLRQWGILDGWLTEDFGLLRPVRPQEAQIGRELHASHSTLKVVTTSRICA